MPSRRGLSLPRGEAFTVLVRSRRGLRGAPWTCSSRGVARVAPASGGADESAGTTVDAGEEVDAVEVVEAVDVVDAVEVVEVVEAVEADDIARGVVVVVVVTDARAGSSGASALSSFNRGTLRGVETVVARFSSVLCSPRRAGLLGFQPSGASVWASVWATDLTCDCPGDESADDFAVLPALSSRGGLVGPPGARLMPRPCSSSVVRDPELAGGKPITANSSDSESELGSSAYAAVASVGAAFAEALPSAPVAFVRGVFDGLSEALARRGDKVTDILAPPCGFVLALQRRVGDAVASGRPGELGARGLDGAPDDALPSACARSGADRKPMPAFAGLASAGLAFATGFVFAFDWFPSGIGVGRRTAPFSEEDCVVIGSILCMWETCECETAAFHNRGAE
jgi:hypothetical protein